MVHCDPVSHKLYIYDCLNGKLRVSNSAFMSIGRAEGCVFRCRMGADVGGSFAIRGGQCHFFPHGSISSYTLNGIRQTSQAVITTDAFNLFVLAGGCLICWFGEETKLPDFSACNPQEWYVYDPTTTRWQGPMQLAALPSVQPTVSPNALAVISGMAACAFRLSDMMEVAEFDAKAQAPQPADIPRSGANQASEAYCPHCWQRFHPAHALAIAAHPKLCGDSLLGEEAQQRFTPTQRDAHGFPLDAMGVAVHDFACPWCHHKLPPFFANTSQHIFPIIGMPAAGKTYYLAGMLHELEYALPREFGIAFRDADPSSNTPLNAMRMRLFSATRPQDAYLGKTSPQGHLYQSVWKSGRYCTLPRPFIYNLSRGSKTCSLTFFDTAGESYEPGSDSLQGISAGQLSAASALFFLFDPTSDSGFRKLIYEGTETRLRQSAHMQERQALMLSETEMRLRTQLHLPPEQKLDVPLAVIIGKSDAWQKLLGPEPLLPCVRNGQFQPKFAEANSKRLRQLLFSISPQICINAEALSGRVHYFAASTFGGEPEAFRDEASGDTLLAPPGGKVYPSRVTDPILWALHCLEPDLLKKPTL